MEGGAKFTDGTGKEGEWDDRKWTDKIGVNSINESLKSRGGSKNYLWF